jgi:hypothetical protein
VKDFIRNYGIFAVLLLQLAFPTVAWFFRKRLVFKEDLDKIADVAYGLNRRVEELEQKRADAPGKSDIWRLRNDMERTRGEILTSAARIEGAEKQLAARCDGIMTLVDRTEHVCNMLTEFLLNREKGS